ncbi:hypothetical protein COW57_01990 [Candidatus Roizmanbacteria bacterium CG17_big_fil_post_rev_8_21_14_2_50_39_7]|uniref:Uncharacterized protein n=1 Tax=Candidatus Roizmanbacteria bacterium CG17_big_fil_post_rev_8_21_14_2_50_39_7 TaxID=1974858 RepID=A0A2M7EKB1_9BACT|nr:MAG: hypothetical protein COW57_01990 [Candidatus Roizmanbacteria bacterium CG17_big_fil_post_rev_8_21_14_2_50_39_7]
MARLKGAQKARTKCGQQASQLWITFWEVSIVTESTALLLTYFFIYLLQYFSLSSPLPTTSSTGTTLFLQ